MQRSDHAAIAARFFDAIEAGDIATVAALYGERTRVWHSDDRLETDVTSNLAILRAFVARTRHRRYEDRRLLVTERGFVQQHRLVAATAAGATLDTPVCIVVTVEDSVIVRIEEYLDARDIARWRASVAAEA